MVGRSPEAILADLAEGKSQLLAVLAERADGHTLPRARDALNNSGHNIIDEIDAEVIEQ